MPRAGSGAGTVIGAGTASNKDPTAGFACIAERRAVETVELGAPRSLFLQAGDRVRIEAVAPDGSSPFGAIEQDVVRVPAGAGLWHEPRFRAAADGR